LDCSLSTPTLLHHDTANGDDVRMSAGLPATPNKDAVKQCASRRYACVPRDVNAMRRVPCAMSKI